MNLHQRPDALTDCDREAIHHIAAIQSFGGLIAADAEGRTAHVSASLPTLLGLTALPPTGTPLADILAPQALEAIRLALAGLPGNDTLGRRFGLDLTGSGALFDCAVHVSCGLSVIEFEPHARTDFADHVSMIVPVIAQL